MQDWQQRVVGEKAELDDRLNKLFTFFGSKIFDSLPEAEQKRMRRQGTFMELYSDVLAERIENFTK